MGLTTKASTDRYTAKSNLKTHYVKYIKGTVCANTHVRPPRACAKTSYDYLFIRYIFRSNKKNKHQN